MKTPPIPFSTLLAGLQDPGGQKRRQAIIRFLEEQRDRKYNDGAGSKPDMVQYRA